MKILVWDKLGQERDLAQMDIYKALSRQFTVSFTACEDYDVLYLGVYAMEVPGWDQIVANAGDRLVIVDQADNEEFAQRCTPLLQSLKNFVVLSRYMPNPAMASLDCRVELFPWHVDADRIIGGKDVVKDLDVCFMASMHTPRRKALALEVECWCKDYGLSYVIGERWGAEYLETLRRAKRAICECDRYCLTQKYLEAAACGCTLFGDQPRYPDNGIVVVGLTPTLLRAPAPRFSHHLEAEYFDPHAPARRLRRIIERYSR